MTDITELATVLRLAAESEIAYRAEGDTSDLWQDEASPDNVLALVEALEKLEKTSEARREAIDRTHNMFVRERDRANAAEEALEKAQTENTAGAAGMAESYETTISMLRSRIAELEESHAQVIHSRDHYKRMSEEGLKQLAVSRTVTVKLPDLRQVVSGDRYVWSDGVFNYSQDVKAELTAKGIKWEAE